MFICLYYVVVTLWCCFFGSLVLIYVGDSVFAREKNGPQFAIQMIYIHQIEPTSVDEVGFLVLFSITLTFLSLLLSLTSFVLERINTAVEYNKNVLQVFTVEVKFCMHCTYLKSHHAFAHVVMSDCLKHVLRQCKHKELWLDRSGVNLHVQVYFIENRVSIDREIDVYAEIDIPCYSISDEVRTIPHRIQEVIGDLSDKKTENCKLFFHVKYI